MNKINSASIRARAAREVARLDPDVRVVLVQNKGASVWGAATHEVARLDLNVSVVFEDKDGSAISMSDTVREGSVHDSNAMIPRPKIKRPSTST